MHTLEGLEDSNGFVICYMSDTEEVEPKTVGDKERDAVHKNQIDYLCNFFMEQMNLLWDFNDVLLDHRRFMPPSICHKLLSQRITSPFCKFQFLHDPQSVTSYDVINAPKILKKNPILSLSRDWLRWKKASIVLQKQHKYWRPSNT